MAIVSIEKLAESVNLIETNNSNNVELLDDSAAILRAAYEATGLEVVKDLFDSTAKHATSFNDVNVKLSRKLVNDLAATEEYAKLINRVDVSAQTKSNADENTAGVDVDALLASV